MRAPAAWGLALAAHPSGGKQGQVVIGEGCDGQPWNAGKVGAGVQRSTSGLWLVRACARGGAGYTLIELMAQSGGRIHEARCVRDVAAPMLRALAALHALGIVHRDVKPEHLICAPGGVKLVDFAHAAQQRHQCLNSRVGQLEYMAPEVLSKPTAADIFHTVRRHPASAPPAPSSRSSSCAPSHGSSLGRRTRSALPSPASH